MVDEKKDKLPDQKNTKEDAADALIRLGGKRSSQ